MESTWRITKEVSDVVLVQYTVPQGDSMDISRTSAQSRWSRCEAEDL